MAHTVGASPDELTAVGRDDAARQLREAADDVFLRQRITAIPGLGTLTSPAGGAFTGQRELLSLITVGLDAIQDSKLSARAKQQLTTLFADNLSHDATRRYEELLLILRLAQTAQQRG
ncbi:MAG TPA: hypothetical protein VLW50_23505 [Streptosporangiaceae bacterium]|nr:hypothetical protein [Streptosporangiaceae bacterium]